MGRNLGASRLVRSRGSDGIAASYEWPLKVELGRLIVRTRMAGTGATQSILKSSWSARIAHRAARTRALYQEVRRRSPSGSFSLIWRAVERSIRDLSTKCPNARDTVSMVSPK